MRIKPLLLFLFFFVIAYLSSLTNAYAQQCADLGGLCQSSTTSYDCCEPLECSEELPGGDIQCEQPVGCVPLGYTCDTASTSPATCCYPYDCNVEVEGSGGDWVCGVSDSIQCKTLGQTCRDALNNSFDCCVPYLCNVILSDGTRACGFQVVTPTPDIYCECAPGSSCTAVNPCGYGYIEYCGEDNFCAHSQECVCATPTPEEDPFPTQAFEQCGEDWCNNPEFPYGSCLDYSPGDICERPTDEDGIGLDEDGSIDCSIAGAGFDCWCCTEYLAPYIEREEMNPLCGSTSINTAIGCIPVGDKNAFFAFILKWALGVSGGISFVLIVASGITIMTAGGDKRKLQGGKELMTAALSGLMLIIFSVFILDFIGIRIFRIPGL